MSNNFGECGLDTVYYEGLRRFENLGEAFAWERQVFKEDNTWNNGPVSDGIVLSPHMTLRINGRAIPVLSLIHIFYPRRLLYRPAARGQRAL